MNKVIFLLCVLLFLAGCKKESAADSAQTAEDTESVTLSQTESEQVYSQEMAMLAGFVVIQDGDVRHNAGIWFDFLETSGAGDPCSVTVVQYNGADYVRYDLDFDGCDYLLTFVTDGQTVTEISRLVVFENGLWEDTMEPYDRFEAYLLNDIVLYRDVITEPDYEGVRQIFLHVKEGEPPVKAYQDTHDIDPILQLLMTAEHISADPEDYAYGMKLLMTNRDGKELVIELDLNYGNYRYGMQTYRYGEVKDMLGALGLETWPDSVLKEFAAFIK